MIILAKKPCGKGFQEYLIFKKNTKLTMNREEKKAKQKLELIAAMENNLGIITAACKDVGLSRETFYKYYYNDEEFKKQIDAIGDYTLDFVETQLLKKIRQGSEKSILFYMRYKGKKRGYTDSLDITSGGKNITEIKLIQVKNNNNDLATDNDA